MSLWGKSESLAAGSGTVVINLSTKAVTGTNSTFLDTMVGKVITVGAAGTCGEAVIASRSSNTAISIASTQFLIPDGSGEFSRKLGMLVAKDNLGFGMRSWRYAAIIKDQIITHWFEEPGFSDNYGEDPYSVSAPQHVLENM